MNMTFFRHVSLAAGCLLLLAGIPAANAQYYELANQLPGLISPALSGSMNYKGYVDFSGVAGFGDNRANIIGISTSQGFQYSSWFFMGAGIGVDVALSQYDAVSPDDVDHAGDWSHSSAKTKVMIPLFSDFRFNIGSQQDVSFFADIKLGAMWLIGNSYLRLQHGYMTGDAQFYFKPSIGIRIPINKSNYRQAVNIGVVYQLITSDNNYNYWNNNTLTLNGIGATISFEW